MNISPQQFTVESLWQEYKVDYPEEVPSQIVRETTYKIANKLVKIKNSGFDDKKISKIKKKLPLIYSANSRDCKKVFRIFKTKGHFDICSEIYQNMAQRFETILEQLAPMGDNLSNDTLKDLQTKEGELFLFQDIYNEMLSLGSHKLPLETAVKSLPLSKSSLNKFFYNISDLDPILLSNSVAQAITYIVNKTKDLENGSNSMLFKIKESALFAKSFSLSNQKGEKNFDIHEVETVITNIKIAKCNLESKCLALAEKIKEYWPEDNIPPLVSFGLNYKQNFLDLFYSMYEELTDSSYKTITRILGQEFQSNITFFDCRIHFI